MPIQNIGNIVSGLPSPAQDSVKPDRAQVVGSSSPVEASTAAPAPVQEDTVGFKAALDELKKVAEAAGNNLNFSVDEETGKTVVRVTDKETGDLIRQIPSEELLAISHSLGKLQGLLLRQEA
jgi:flagellar protein FlaG